MEQQGWNVGTSSQQKGLAQKTEQVILVGLVTRDQTEDMITEYLDELEFLALTAGAKTVKRFIQKMDHPNRRTFVGKGKMEEIAEYIETHEDITADRRAHV